MKKILILLIGCVCFSACDNGELEQLRQENVQLKEQIAKLSETEQNRFNKAVDLFNAANDLQSYRMAEKTFGDFIEKFPTSTYLESAKQHKQQAKNKADNIEKINQVKTELGTLIAERKWKTATNKVNSIKDLLDQNEYSSLLKKIEEERYKPQKTTIDKLAAEIYELSNSYKEADFNKYFDFQRNGRRVEVIGYISPSSLDVKRKSFRAYGKSGCMTGERAEIFYDKTNLVNYFLNLNPDSLRCGDSYRIIGKAKIYSNSDSEIYIQAESIEKI